MAAAIGVLVALAFGQHAYAISTMTVGSAEVTAGQTGVVIPVFLKNEVAIRGVELPLLIRKLGPAYPTKIKIDISDRMVGKLGEIVFYKQYDTGTLDEAICKRYVNTAPGTPGGFPATATYIVNSDATPKEPQLVTTSPYGIYWARNRFLNLQQDLDAGRDATGSFLITADIAQNDGCFEIDTTCMNPAAHLQINNQENKAVPRTFAQGTIHVGECTGTVLGTPASVPAERRGPQSATLTWAAVDDAIGYEVEVDNVDNTFQNLIAKVTVQETQFTVTVGDEESVFWRVRAVPRDCSYCFGPWAGPQMYTDVQTVASSGVPDSYTLNQNYPNPFNASTVIEFTNKRDGHVNLQVYNILGQNVVTLMDDFKPVGKYAITWDGTDSHGNVVPSGMYFYRVTTGNFTAVKKMTLLK